MRSSPHCAPPAGLSLWTQPRRGVSPALSMKRAYCRAHQSETHSPGSRSLIWWRIGRIATRQSRRCLTQTDVPAFLSIFTSTRRCRTGDLAADSYRVRRSIRHRFQARRDVKIMGETKMRMISCRTAMVVLPAHLADAGVYRPQSHPDGTIRGHRFPKSRQGGRLALNRGEAI